MRNLYTFSRLSKICKRDTSCLQKYNLAVLGDCDTQHLTAAIKGYAYTQNLDLNIFNADYNQILPQVMNSCSEMYNFKPNAILLYLCVEKLYAIWCETPQNDRSVFAETEYSHIREYWKYIDSNCEVNILQFTFAEYDDYIFGNYASKQPSSFIFQLRKLNLILMEECIKHKNVFLVDICGIQARVGREKLYDPKLYYIAKIPISLNVLPLVAENVVTVIQSLLGTLKKCVVVDLDNTLWGGVIGDEGLSGIQIGELGIGHAFSEFQVWLKELKKRGVLLAVCSKNEETTAKEPFEKHNEMILRLEDFSIFVANWNDKASNIRYIQQTLNIGMDSMVFIDDSPFERELVRSFIPEITVPDLPDDPAEYLPYLQSLNLFETISFSMEDANRTSQYHDEAQRESIRRQYADYDEYLQSLEMTAVAAAFDEFHAPRIAQLTQRSNQFNLRTIRYTESDIEASAKNSNQITFYFTLNDKIADHGLISVVIMEKQDNKTLFINTWLMSCRVLKRSMEEFIINRIIDEAKLQGYDRIVGEYIRTTKNTMVADIYEKLGFTRTSENLFAADVNSFKYNRTCIKERQL